MNPLNPELIKGLAKALIRIDDNLKENNRITQSNYAEIGILIESVSNLDKRLKKIEKEIAKLKQAKK
ncbi:hypothetical protein BLW90_07305 [Helicobacter pylori]|nr:hypothetical protein AP072_0205885 [Helicobacter pylori]OKA01764.1 hypothetical protein AV922_0205410 [Helicobacter pylori]OMQ16997.1 hypothetical protein BLW89_07300 [Helicobacter pylori]OMQ17019.1 hypothetical protein BLW90_07305 [Helicobacter pylori]